LLITHAGCSKAGFAAARNQKDAPFPRQRASGRNLPKTIRHGMRKRLDPGKKRTKKIRSRSQDVTATLINRTMTQRLLLSCLAAVLLASTGCSVFRRNSKSKDNALASETEENLKRRFIDRRTAELTAQGIAADAAKVQATEEFRQKYEYTSAAKK
jgi:hypothetical protein